MAKHNENSFQTSQVSRSCGMFFYGFIYIWSRVLKTDLLEEPLQYAPEIIEETKSVRDNRLGPEDEYTIQVDVDYTEGESARWYPKGESPIKMIGD